MKLNQLRMVLAIADKGSLRAAARSLGISQPSLTHSLGELERELGATLFERQARGMVATPVGQVFMRRAAVIDCEARRIPEEVAQFLGKDQGGIVAALSIAAHLALLPMALPLFLQRFPGVRVRILERAYPAIETQLREGSVDFYVGPAPDPPAGGEFVVEKLFDNSRAVFARRGHPLANAKSLAELSDAQWIATGLTDRAEVELQELFERHGLPPPRPTMQADSMLSMLTTLMSSDAVTMTLRQYEEFPLTQGAVQRIRVREELPAPPIVIIRRAALPLTPAGDYFCDMFRRAAVAYLQS